MAQGKQLARQWQILRILENHHYGISLEELSERAEVTRRTIERDLSSLVEMGFPIQTEVRENNKKFWRLTSHFLESDTLIFTPTEIISFYLANKLINPLAGTCLGDSWEEFLKNTDFFTTEVSVSTIASTLLFSFVLGLFIFLIYRVSYKGVMYSKTFNVTLIAISMITASISVT